MYFSGPVFAAYVNKVDEDGYDNCRYLRQQIHLDFAGVNSVGPVSDELATLYVNREQERIYNRDSQASGKWYRPWDVVPELRNWSAPAGDFGVGVEVEMGFNSRADARHIAQMVKDWEYMTLDFEGGDYPIEATFPPVLYSTFADSMAVKYTNILKENESRIVKHRETAYVGTHMNVSVGGGLLNNGRIYQLERTLRDMFDDRDNYHLAKRYFGREPYDYCFGQGIENEDDEDGMGTSMARWVEYKLFNSQLDSKRLMQYADIAVSLTKLLVSSEPINTGNVHIALEEGYSILGDIAVSANLSDNAEQLALAIAA